jgi:choline dehydrogenase-like flavoprotein
MNDANATYDVVVIGTGVAGALIAWKLSARKGAKILMLEAGEKRLDDRKQFVKIFAELSQKVRSPIRPYTQIDDDNKRFSHSPDAPEDFLKQGATPVYYQQSGPDMFKSQYARLVGGSTWAWRGNCPRNAPNDFRLFERYKRGVDWPISYDELEPFYCDAEDALGVAGDHDEWNSVTRRSRPFPMPKIAQAYGDRELMEALGKTKFDGVDVRLLGLPQARNSKPYDGRPACQGNNNCIPICPIQAKYDATVHVKKALQNNVALIERAVVTELQLDPNGNIDTVVYKSWDGAVHTAKGRIVVLAANTIESAKIWQLSNGGQGLDNTSGQVGCNLMDHIGGEGAALMPFAVFPFRGPQSTSCIESFRDHKDRDKFAGVRLTIGNDGWGRGKHPYDNLKEATGGDLKDLAAKRLFGAELQAELLKTISHQMRIAYSIEQLPDANNRVFPSKTEKDDLGIPKPQIVYKVDQYSLDGAAYAQRIIKHIFTTVRAPEETWEFSDLKARAYSGSAHIMGTLRMAKDVKSGVVDSNCRSFEHKNLFVADASVFATSAPTNPTITVAALALRTAKAIEQQLANG